MGHVRLYVSVHEAGSMGSVQCRRDLGHDHDCRSGRECCGSSLQLAKEGVTVVGQLSRDVQYRGLEPESCQRPDLRLSVTFEVRTLVLLCYHRATEPSAFSRTVVMALSSAMR